MRFSPSVITGNSTGNPPASSTPRLIAAAMDWKCRLQLTSSDQQLQIPITGRPLIAAWPRPSARMEARWMNPPTPSWSNHSLLRGLFVMPILG